MPTSNEAPGWLQRQCGATQPAFDGAMPLFGPRRQHTRYGTRHLQVESPVYGWAVNVSEAGLQLESLTPLLAGADHIFRLRYGSSFLSLPGRVIWSRLASIHANRLGEQLGIHQAGIELADGASNTDWREALERLTGVTLCA